MGASILLVGIGWFGATSTASYYIFRNKQEINERFGSIGKVIGPFIAVLWIAAMICGIVGVLNVDSGSLSAAIVLGVFATIMTIVIFSKLSLFPSLDEDRKELEE